MSKPTPEADALLRRMITRGAKVCREAEQVLRDIASLQDLHPGDPAWAFLEEEKAWWIKTNLNAASIVRQCQRKRQGT